MCLSVCCCCCYCCCALLLLLQAYCKVYLVSLFVFLFFFSLPAVFYVGSYFVPGITLKVVHELVWRAWLIRLG